MKALHLINSGLGNKLAIDLKDQTLLISGNLETQYCNKIVAGSGSPSNYQIRVYNGKKHPLELFNLIEDADLSRYHSDGIVRIKTKQDLYVIWQNNEFSYEPPF